MLVDLPATKKFGGGGGVLHRPLFDRVRWGGQGEGGGRVVEVWGRAAKPAPSVRSADGGDDCRRDAPSLSSAPVRPARLKSAAANRDREETRVVAGLHAQENRALAARAGIRQRFPNLVRAGDAL